MMRVFFHQDCKVCGRPMLVRIELLGARIECGHCRAECAADCAEAIPVPAKCAESSKRNRLSSIPCGTSPFGYASTVGAKELHGNSDGFQ